MLVFGIFILRSHPAFIHNYRLALDELFIYGYGSGGRLGSGVITRAGFMYGLATYSVIFYVVALVAVAVKSATGVTSEREARTWDGLLSTPLEPAEVVRAKVLGALVRRRALLLLVLIPWLIGLALGALYPVGLLLAVAGLAAFLWFASALGILFSLRSRNSRQALARTLGVLLVLNLGTLLPGVLLLGSSEAGILFGNTAVLLLFLPISTYHMRFFVVYSAWTELLFRGLLLGSVAAYAALAWDLSRAATRGFDAAVDRPRHVPSRDSLTLILVPESAPDPDSSPDSCPGIGS